ncbi:carbonic anhydrase 2-like [Planococcus citri]|uniref:carbonic anhydrase 2-like n=1 Tax=Planococcus citri TaxID=170843 RepID=UPI0031F81E56
MKYCLIIFSIFNSYFIIVSSKKIDSVWPVDDSIPFPYPTPDPINIIPSRAEYIRTPKPLTIEANFALLSYVTNTGSSLIVTAKRSMLSTIATGGVLYNDSYIFFQREFFWDSSLKHSSGATINGYGTPLQTVISFYNRKYGTLENAKSKRDGIFQVVVFIRVGPIPNPLFYPFELVTQAVKKANSTILIPEILTYDFYLLPSLRQDYYAYPGEYFDHESGNTYFSSTVTLWRRFPPPFISYDQFKATFGSFLDKSGKPYSHVVSRYPRGYRPLKHVILSGIALV